MAVPKGRILKQLQPLLKIAEIDPEPDFFNEDSRKIIFKTSDESIEIAKVRSFDVATFIKFGSADIGICGSDVLEEFPSDQILKLLDLKISKCRISVASLNKSLQDLEKSSHIRLATKYINLAENYFSQIGVQVETIKLNGAIEIAPHLNLCDFILDLVSTGETLLQNNLVEILKIKDVSSYFVANRYSFKANNQKINFLISKLDNNLKPLSIDA